MRAIQIQRFGGPEVMQLTELPVPEPAEGHVLVKVARCGVNYADTHARENTYLAEQQLPLIPGAEVSGTVEALGPGAEGLEVGQRIASLTMNGGYAEYTTVPAMMAVPLPDDVDDDTGAALLLQGMTAHQILTFCGRMEPGESVVVHAAGGGVGTLAVQLAKHLGAGRVIATASSAEKRELALSLGADVAVDPATEDLKAALIEANEGRRVDIVLEMAGGPVFDQSLEALAPFGRLVCFGAASGETNQVSSGRLMQKSRAVIGYWLMHSFGKPELVKESLRTLFEGVSEGWLRVVAGGVYPLGDAARAHADMQARRTKGKILLDPSA